MSDLALAENPRAIIGSNQPPAEPPTPYELAVKAVNDIYEETILWLDGKPIDSQELADGVGNLQAEIRKAHALAEAARVAEKAPLDELVAEVQARYAPLIGNTKSVKGKTVLALDACKSALEPWLKAEDMRIKEMARLAREEADQKAREAAEALQAAEPTDLAARADAEAKFTEAKRADTAANVAGRKTATAGGDFGRSVGLRTAWVPVMTDPVFAARHYWQEAREEMHAFLIGLAERDVRAGKRSIPGFSVTEAKRAV